MKLLIRKHAARLFAEYGVGAVGLYRVAGAVGVSEPTLRHYYASRRDLLVEVLGEHLSGLNEAVGAAFDARPPGPTRLESVITAWLDHVAAEPLLGTLRALLDDPTAWPEPDSPEDRTRRTRRVTGMLIAAASAETAGAWPVLGPAEPAPAPRLVECSQARARLKELLDAVSAGADITVTRHGRPAVRLVRAEGLVQNGRAIPDVVQSALTSR